MECANTHGNISLKLRTGTQFDVHMENVRPRVHETEMLLLRDCRPRNPRQGESRNMPTVVIFHAFFTGLFNHRAERASLIELQSMLRTDPRMEHLQGLFRQSLLDVIHYCSFNHSEHVSKRTVLLREPAF